MKKMMCMGLFCIALIAFSGCINDTNTYAKIQINNKTSDSYDVRFFAEDRGEDECIITVPAKTMSEEKKIPAGSYILYLRKTNPTGKWENNGTKYYSGGLETTETISSSGSLN